MNLEILAIVLGLALQVGCSGEKMADPSPARPPAAEPAPPAPPEPTGPEIVELPIPPDEIPPDDCVAGEVEGGVFDEKSPAYRKIEVKRHRQFVFQRATSTSGQVVTARIGGCAHHGAHYTVELPRTRPVTDRAHYVGAALDALAPLPTRAGADNYLDEIAKELRGALGDKARLEECSFSINEMVTIGCTVSEEGDGVVVGLGYDIAL